MFTSLKEYTNSLKIRISESRTKWRDEKYAKYSLEKILIVIEILAILSLIWFLRAPLSKKYLALSPKTYSVALMNNKSRYLVYKGDYFVGKTIPRTKVVTLITPGKIKKSVIADKDGNWSFKVADSLALQKDKFTVGYFDKSNKLTFFKTYRIRIESNNVIKYWWNKLLKLNPFLPKKASAQDDGSDPNPEPDPDTTTTEEVIGTTTDLDPNAGTVYPLPQNFNIEIANIGSDTDNLEPGHKIFPQSLIYDQDGQQITGNDQLSLSYVLQGDDGSDIALTSGDDCSGLNVCSRQIPDGLSSGTYNLIAVLNVSGQDPVRSAPASLSIGENQPSGSLQTDSDPNTGDNLSQGSCFGQVCPTQSGAAIVPLNNLYSYDASYNNTDGSAINIAGDCGDNCTRPGYIAEGNYLQQDVNLDSASQNDDLVSCLKDSKTNPSSSLSLVAGIATLVDMYQAQPLSQQGLDDVFNQFLSSGALSCSLNDYSQDSLTQLGTNTGLFNATARFGESYQSLESSYQADKNPVLVQTKFQQSDLHYVLVLAITDNYVWVADSLDPGTPNYALRINKDDFTNNFFNGNYWEISPNYGQQSYKAPLNQNNLAIGHAFLRAANNNEVTAFALDDNGEVAAKTSITSADDKFYILGKYRDNDYMYKINFINSDGNFIIPIRETVIDQGNALDVKPDSGQRNNFVGVRLNPPFFYDDNTEEFRNNMFDQQIQDVNKLGVGKVRIVIEDAQGAVLDNLKPVIERAFDNGYFVLFQYKPGSRIPKGVEQVTLNSFIQYLDGLGVRPDRYAFELYNEPNLRHYWNDCRTQPIETDEEISSLNPDAVGFSTDENTGERVYIKDCENEESYADALSIAIKQDSDILWSIHPDIKIIIGAISLQGGNPDTGTIQDEDQRLLDVYLGELNKYADLSKYDYAIHGYQVWDSGPLRHADGSDKGADGLLHVYNAYKNNQYIRNAKGDHCNCLWITEFSVDQLNYDAYNLITIMENIRNTAADEGMINSVFIHEFNGVTEPGNKELWQLWDNGTKLPSYNLVQYYLLQQLIRS